MKEFCKNTQEYLSGAIPFKYRILCLSLLVYGLIFLPLSLHGVLLANTRGKILILNSDMSISNYSLAHTGFKTKLTDNIIESELDLGNKWIEESKIKDKINDLNPDVIYCIGSKAYLLAYKLAENKNLIFTSMINWRRFPMGKNTYGVSAELLPGMQMTLYSYFFPEVNKIGVLFSDNYNKEWWEFALRSAHEVDIEVIGKVVSRQDEIEPALQELLAKVDALWLIPDPIVLSKTELVDKIFRQCNNAQKPVFTYSDAFANYGATLIITADIPTAGRQAAELALDLLSKRRIPERVQTPAGSYIILNLQQVEKQKLKLNEEALDSVNQIIR